MSDEPKPRTFKERLEQGIVRYDKEPREYTDSAEELLQKQKKARKVSKRKKRISLEKLSELITDAATPKAPKIKNKKLLRDVMEVRGWMAKGPDFCSYENAYKPWQRIHETLERAFWEGDEQAFNDFAEAWKKWKPSTAYKKQEGESYRDPYPKSRDIYLYRNLPCLPSKLQTTTPNLITVIGYISALQTKLGWAPTQAEIVAHSAKDKSRDGGMSQSEVSRICGNSNITQLLSIE